MDDLNPSDRLALSYPMPENFRRTWIYSFSALILCLACIFVKFPANSPAVIPGQGKSPEGQPLLRFVFGMISVFLAVFAIFDSIFVFTCLLRLLLPRLGAVRNCLLDDPAPAKVIAQRRFQRRNFPFFHGSTTRSSPVGISSLSKRKPGKQPAVSKRSAPNGAPSLRPMPRAFESHALFPLRYFAGSLMPPINCTKRSFSLRAASPAFVPGLVKSTA